MLHVAHTSDGRTYCLLAPLFHKALISRLLCTKWVKGKHNISCLNDIVSSKCSKNLLNVLYETESVYYGIFT
jgi:hypothetical protein